MAGGMGIPRRGVPLRDRPVVTGLSETPRRDQRPGRQRHCLVDQPDGQWQGLILQWAKEPAGWVALTIYVKPGPGGDVAVQEWIPAERLTAGS